MQVIKTVRELTGLGLKEAKELVESTQTNQEKVSKEELKGKRSIEKAEQPSKSNKTALPDKYNEAGKMFACFITC